MNPSRNYLKGLVHMICILKIDSPAVVAEDTANITNNASSLDSFAVTVVSRIIEDLTKSAIEIEEVT